MENYQKALLRFTFFSAIGSRNSGLWEVAACGVLVSVKQNYEMDLRMSVQDWAGQACAGFATSSCTAELTYITYINTLQYFVAIYSQWQILGQQGTIRIRL
jgi:hypothetical protein